MFIDKVSYALACSVIYLPISHVSRDDPLADVHWDALCSYTCLTNKPFIHTDIVIIAECFLFKRVDHNISSNISSTSLICKRRTGTSKYPLKVFRCLPPSQLSSHTMVCTSSR